MNPGLFLRGLTIGFAVGPIGLLVIRRTIERGWALGFLSGVGVATADATYRAIAAFGLTALTAALVGIDRPAGIVGGAVLVVMAVRGIRTATTAGPSRSREEDARAGRASRLDGPAGAWASMMGLTLTNPATILSFTALFASIGAGTGGPGGAALVVAGVFSGSVAWWVILTGLVARLRARFTPRVVRLLNVASSLVIGAFGVVAIGIGLGG